MTRPIPKEAIALIKLHEGCRLRAYKCPAGVWTIGYGQTGPDVREGTAWTQERAEAALSETIAKFADAVDRLVEVPVTDNQRGALVSFAYNLGAGALGSSTLLRLLNAERYQEAADQFPRWNKSGGKVLPGLTARRAAERALFLKKD